MKSNLRVTADRSLMNEARKIEATLLLQFELVKKKPDKLEKTKPQMLQIGIRSR